MRITLFISICLILSSCRERVYLSKGKETVLEKAESSKEKEYSVSGMVTSSSSYCGGARPTDEILRELTSPKPYSGYTFYVKKGTVNEVGVKYLMEIKADKEGKFSFGLPPGDYIFVDAVRLDSTYYKSILTKYSKTTESYSAADTACMNQWLAGSLYQLKVVDSDFMEITWDIHTRCFVNATCIHYNGPYPP